MKNLFSQTISKQSKKKVFGFLFLWGFLFCCVSGLAQNHQDIPSAADSVKEVVIKGHISGEKSKDIMAGATIFFNDKARGITDELGYYTILIPDRTIKNTNILKVKLLGYFSVKDTLNIKTGALHRDYILRRDSTFLDPNKPICIISREEWMKERYSVNK